MDGKCFCGAIRYRLDARPSDSYLCHCRDCQQLSGSAFHALSIVRKSDFHVIRGTPKTFEHKTQDGSTLARSFCPDCGTPLFNLSSRFDDIVMFTTTTLDKPQDCTPSFQIWMTSTLPWEKNIADLASYPYGAMDGDNKPGS